MNYNKDNFEDVMYDLIQEYAHKPVESFLNEVGEVFGFRTHKWSVFDNENAPIGDCSEKTVWTDDGYEMFDITLDGYDEVGHVECNYNLLKTMLFGRDE